MQCKAQIKEIVIAVQRYGVFLFRSACLHEIVCICLHFQRYGSSLSCYGLQMSALWRGWSWWWAKGGVLDTMVSAGSFHIGFLPTGYWPTFYVAKLRRTVNATSTGTAYFGIFHWQPSTVFSQKTGYSRWICRNSLSSFPLGSPFGLRCKSLYPTAYSQ